MTETSSAALPAPQAIAPAVPTNLRYRGLRTIVALILREMSTTYGRSPGGYIWAILQPVAMIILLTLAFSFLLRSPSLGTSFVLFYATGFMILRQFQEVTSAVGASISFNQALLAYPRVTYVDTLAARSILAVLTQIMVSAIIFTGIFIIEDIRVILDFGPILLTYAMTILLAVGIGIFNAYMSFSFPVYKMIWGVLTRPLMLLSGIFYTYEDLPVTVQNILWYNPLIHLTGLVRTGFYSTYDPGYISLIYVALLGTVPAFFGFLLLRKFSKDILYK
ncbi:putative cell surface polysaccharide export ABC-2 transporter permease protein, close relative to wzm1Y20833 [Roseobacter sp. SK209-2-6]|uniref:ABC transporter permease n=1 Tax=Roseobacter sp. SK209-2-6 TaxID=388739 RepID=UPI0000F3F1B3|nr:ABC transporter permease [Roseobacter sp. SK209-2-6]EBA14535.1 putative cell surface polysaccharide export ABC-2 transporter permease protein, close relative to wzm1Y20833 [Roseobacter sp. SK209-2-6]